MTTRRGFLQGILASCAAPAIVKVANLMPVTSATIHIPTDEEVATIMHFNPDGTFRRGGYTQFGKLTQIQREMWSRELARHMAEQLDRTVFEVLTKGVL